VKTIYYVGSDKYNLDFYNHNVCVCVCVCVHNRVENLENICRVSSKTPIILPECCSCLQWLHRDNKLDSNGL